MLQGVTTMEAVQQPRFAGGLAAAGYLLPPRDDGDQQMWALKDHAGCDADDDWYPYPYYYDCAAAARSDLTCNGGSGAAAVLGPSRKRGREDDDLERYFAAPSSAAALLPVPGMSSWREAPVAAVAPQTMATSLANVAATRTAQPLMASTSGRSATSAIVGVASVEDALVAEMRQQDAEIDEVVRAGCDRLRAGLLERARKRRCVALVRAVAARVLRDREVELAAARRRVAELEERLRQAAAEGQAWRDVARSNEAVAAGLRGTLETLLLGGGGGAPAMPATKEDEEGFGDSGDPPAAAAADEARSCCFDDAAAASRWPCRACGGGGEASVLLLPCRHLCLCKACEPRADACPVCLAAKSGAIHVAAGW